MARTLQLLGRPLRLREVPGSLIRIPPGPRPDFAEHRHEPLLLHPLERPQGLEAVADRVLSQPFGLLSPEKLGLGGQLAVGLGQQHTQWH